MSTPARQLGPLLEASQALGDQVRDQNAPWLQPGSPVLVTLRPAVPVHDGLRSGSARQPGGRRPRLRSGAHVQVLEVKRWARRGVGFTPTAGTCPRRSPGSPWTPRVAWPAAARTRGSRTSDEHSPRWGTPAVRCAWAANCPPVPRISHLARRSDHRTSRRWPEPACGIPSVRARHAHRYRRSHRLTWRLLPGPLAGTASGSRRAHRRHDTAAAVTPIKFFILHSRSRTPAQRKPTWLSSARAYRSPRWSARGASDLLDHLIRPRQ